MGKTKNIDYYGNNDNYIHLKFGEALKCYNFTPNFREKYPDFVKGYVSYWNGERKAFRNPFELVSYVFNNKIPVYFYFNYTDTPAKDRQEIINYLLNENDKKVIREHELK